MGLTGAEDSCVSGKSATMPSGWTSREKSHHKNHAAHMKTVDRGKYELVQKEADFARVRIDGEMLKGVYLVRKVRLKGKERWLFWKGSTE